MPGNEADRADLKSVKQRLDEIVEAVSDESLSLDEALSFYEEAVELGMKASELMEADIAEHGQEEGEADQWNESSM